MPEDGESKPQTVLVTSALIKEPRKPTIFKGDPGQDPNKWLKEYLRVSKFNQWDDTLSLANVYFFLDGTAKAWFENNEDTLQSWDIFEAELKKTFGDTQLYIRRAKDRLKCRAQRNDEATQSYIQDVLGLCNQVDPEMTEDDKVSHLLKGIAEDMYQALLTKEIKTTADFIKWCQYIEEMQQKRIGRQKFARLPNVIPVAAIGEEQDLISLIRRVVREEIQRQTTPQIEEPQVGLQAIESIVRDELGKTLAPLSGESPERFVPTPKRRLQPTYNKPKPVREQFYRKTDLWRTTDNRPVCFHCGRPGHVVRYCRDRKSLFDASRRNYRRDASSFHDYSHNVEGTSRPRGRISSPSPTRGRSPNRRYRSPSPYQRSSQSPLRRSEEN